MRNGSNVTGDQLDALRPNDVQLYLESRGWRPAKKGTELRGGMVFHNPKFRGADVLLPIDRKFKDFSRRMGDLVVTLATLEDRALDQVLDDISGPMCDALRLRVVSPETSLGSVPLDEGLRLLKGGHDLLRSAAYSVVKPGPLHPQHDVKLVREFLQGCRLGQTDRGSFVATILTPPVPPELSSPESLPFPEGDVTITDPFVRQVTNGLIESLNTLSTALRSASRGTILKAAPKGVSANLCEALVEMEPQGEQSQLDLSVNWARSRPIKATDLPSTVSLSKDDFPILKEAARLLRARSTRRLQYEGQIVELRTSSRTLFDPDDGGRVVIVTRVEGRRAMIKVELTKPDYVRACDAHRDHLDVRISGLIHQDEKNNVFVLSEPRDFQVLEEATPAFPDSTSES